MADTVGVFEVDDVLVQNLDRSRLPAAVLRSELREPAGPWSALHCASRA
jgi:hypothetical protein